MNLDTTIKDKIKSHSENNFPEECCGLLIEKDEGDFFPNQFLMLVSNSNEKKTELARFSDYVNPLKKIHKFDKTRNDKCKR